MRSWSRETGVTVGAVFEPERLWELSRRWYDDRLQPDWRRKTIPERQSILAEVGLTGPFWRLGP